MHDHALTRLVGGLSERELIRRVLAGDAFAERALYDAHVDRVYRLCYRIANGDPELAQDFTQEAFVRAFTRLAEFRGEAALGTWLHTVALTIALNGMRRVKQWQLRETVLDETTPVGATAPRVGEPGLSQRLRAAIGELPEANRTVFLMYDVEGYTHDEIAAALAIPSGTSKARLSRARAQLRTALAEYAGEWA